jgi:hypothetical protein
MVIGACTIEIELPGMTSLKDKRSVIKTLIARLHKEFNVAAAEVDLHDRWEYTVIGVASVSTSAAHAQSLLQNLLEFIERTRPDLEIIDHYVEIVHFSAGSGQ